MEVQWLASAVVCLLLSWIACVPAQLQGRGSYNLISSKTTGFSSTGISATHAVWAPRTSRVLVFSRVQDPAVPYQPRMAGNLSAVFDTETGEYEPVYSDSPMFCAGHSHISDGRIVVMGGDIPTAIYGTQGFGYMVEGRDAVRYFDPLTNTFTRLTGQNQKLGSYHWYPTQLTLPDDRVINCGGYYSDGSLGGPNPMCEIFDARTNTVVAILPNQGFLSWWGQDWKNLYPTMILLPYTAAADPTSFYIFLYGCNWGMIIRATAANTLAEVQMVPPLPEAGGYGTNYCSAFSATGTGSLLALDPANNYAAEFVMFGGNLVGGATCPCDWPALDSSYRITLKNAAGTLLPTNQWIEETMPVKRAIGCNVVLPNGWVFITSGMQAGRAAGGPFGGGEARDPAYAGVIYDPYAPQGQRYTRVASSLISRNYHNTCLMMVDGNVWIGGSEQGECVSQANGMCNAYPFPKVEFRAERYRPPYPTTAFPRPRISNSNVERTVQFGATLAVAFTRGVPTRASLVHPGANTHGLDMSARVIFCTITVQGNLQGGTATVQMPTYASRVAQPGWYMLYLLNNNSPSERAVWVRLTV